MRLLLFAMALCLCQHTLAAEIAVAGGREVFALPTNATLLSPQCAQISKGTQVEAVIHLISAGYRQKDRTPAAFQRSVEQDMLAPAGWEAAGGSQAELFGTIVTQRRLHHRNHRRVMVTMYFLAEDTPQLLMIEALDEGALDASLAPLVSNARRDPSRESRRETLRNRLKDGKLAILALRLGGQSIALVFLRNGVPESFFAGEVVFRLRARDEEAMTELAPESAFSLSIGVNGVRMPEDTQGVLAYFGNEALCENALISPPKDAKH